MSLWQKPAELAALNRLGQGSLVAHLGIELTELGADYLVGRMPVDERTRQPMGLLHGGASVVLAESLGSLCGYLAAPEGHHCVGVEVNANHLKGVRSGWVTGTARPLKVGRRLQVWQIEISNEAGEAVASSRLTLAVVADRR